MTYMIISNLAIGAIGLLAARMGDRLRGPIFGKKPCDGSRSSRVVWSYTRNVASRNAAWLTGQTASDSPCA